MAGPWRAYPAAAPRSAGRNPAQAAHGLFCRPRAGLRPLRQLLVLPAAPERAYARELDGQDLAEALPALPARTAAPSIAVAVAEKLSR